MSENEWHGTRTWQLEPSTFLKRETTGSLSSEYYKLYSVANADDSTRFDNIFNPLSQTLAEYFQSLLQIEFRYAFPCRKRWFLRPPVSQHHLAANRLPVWRFAAVWVGQPSISRDSFCPKISVWSRLTFYALAVLSSLTFFRVGGNTECIQRHSTATSQINLW